jgi:hypothetical protein
MRSLHGMCGGFVDIEEINAGALRGEGRDQLGADPGSAAGNEHPGTCERLIVHVFIGTGHRAVSLFGWRDYQ